MLLFASSVSRGSGRALFLSIFFLVQAPCATAQNKPLEPCKANPVGARAPKLASSQDAADHLRQKINFKPWWIYRNTLAIIFTPLKRAGFRGWTDYCSVACALGEVRHAVGGIDGMYTVDLALSAFRVNEEETHLSNQRFIRVELFPAVKKHMRDLPRKGDSVRICGRLMWDADGFLEIHPRDPEEIQFLVPASASVCAKEAAVLIPILREARAGSQVPTRGMIARWSRASCLRWPGRRLASQRHVE